MPCIKSDNCWTEQPFIQFKCTFQWPGDCRWMQLVTWIYSSTLEMTTHFCIILWYDMPHYKLCDIIAMLTDWMTILSINVCTPEWACHTETWCIQPTQQAYTMIQLTELNSVHGGCHYIVSTYLLGKWQ